MANDKYEGLVRLNQGDEPKDVADDLGVSLAKVIRWRTELKRATETDAVAKLLAAEAEVIDDVVAGVLVQQPEAEEKLKDLTKGVAGLKSLDTALQETAMQLNKYIFHQAAAASNVGELSELTTALCALQSAFFGKGTQINIQNNVDTGAASYGAYLSDGPG